MFKACSACGRIHGYNSVCRIKAEKKTEERRLRNQTAWKHKAKEIKEKANYLCEVCRDDNVYNYKHLDAHHVEKIKDAPERLLDDTNIIILCREHHKQAEDGKLSKEYLHGLIKARERR